MSMRWFRRLMRLFPADFRADYGRDMERTFRAQEREAREHGRAQVAGLWWETLRDVLCSASREHADQVAQDARYAYRVFRVAPGFTFVAVLTLAVGIGANTAAFSVVHAVLLQPLPFPEPDRLVRIYERNVASGLFRNSASPPNLLDWQQQSSSFTAIAGYRRRSVNLSGSGEPRYVHGARASATFFGILGVSPMRGRTFTEAEDRRGAAVAVISYALWQSHFAGDEGVVGRAFDLDGEPFTVIGVLPSNFAFQLASEVWLPLGVYPGIRVGRGARSLHVVARLKPGVAVEQAQADIATIASRLERQYPQTNTRWSAFVEPLRESGVHDVRTLVLVLLGAVGFVLLVACANIGSMLVTRAAGRGGEFAVRVALGASRARLTRQLLTETAILAMAGGALGVALASALVEALRRFQTFAIPRLDEAALHPPVLVATAGVTLLTGLLFGLLPAMHVGRWEGRGRLRGTSRSDTPGRERRRVQAVLNVAQIAAAVVLLAGAGVMVRTLFRLNAVDIGFDPSGVTAVDISLSDARYPTDEIAVRFYERVVSEIAAAPGIERAALVSHTPLVGGVGLSAIGFAVEGRPPKPPGQEDFAYVRWITPQYFDTLRVPLVRGRMFTETDGVGRPAVAVVNAEFVRRHFTQEDPIGRRVAISMRDVPREIVGVVADIRQTAVDAAPEPQIYVPAYQSLVGSGTLLVRGKASSLEATLDVVRDAVRRVDAQQPLFNARAMDADVAASVGSRRVTTQALSALAAMAVGLALMGIYTVGAYQVGERTREFGVRVAVGARGADILAMVVRQGMMPVVAGVLVGLGGAAMLTRVLSALLFETEPLHGGAFAAAAGVLLATGFAACLLPARRAMRVDPSTALRVE